MSNPIFSSLIFTCENVLFLLGNIGSDCRNPDHDLISCSLLFFRNLGNRYAKHIVSVKCSTLIRHRCIQDFV